MTNVFDRFTKVVQSELNHRLRRRDDGSVDAVDAAPGPASAAASGLQPGLQPSLHAGLRSVTDVKAAAHVLELPDDATLDMVRARYRELSQRYHPKTLSSRADEAHAAQVVLLSLTEALELLEEHLLPLPPARRA